MSYIRSDGNQHPLDKERYWCRNCWYYVHLSEMKDGESDDDQVQKKDCPGCDLTLVEIIHEQGNKL